MKQPIPTGVIELSEVLHIESRSELYHEIDTRISASEVRTRYWIVAGFSANIISLLLAVVPMIYYLGKISHQAEVALTTIQVSETRLDARTIWMADRIHWEEQIEGHLNFKPTVSDKLPREAL